MINNEKKQQKNTIRSIDDLPPILTAQDIANYLRISERRAYEIMELKSFPLIRLGRSKRANRESFMRWLQENERSE